MDLFTVVVIALSVISIANTIFVLFLFRKFRPSDRAIRQLSEAIDDLQRTATIRSTAIKKIEDQLASLSARPAVDFHTDTPNPSDEAKSVTDVVKQFNNNIYDLSDFVRSMNCSRAALDGNVLSGPFSGSNSASIVLSRSGDYLLFEFGNDFYCVPSTSMIYDMYSALSVDKVFEVDKLSDNPELKLSKLILPARCSRSADNAEKYDVQEKGHIQIS